MMNFFNLRTTLNSPNTINLIAYFYLGYSSMEIMLHYRLLIHMYMEAECLTLICFISKLYSAGNLERKKNLRLSRYQYMFFIDLGLLDQKCCLRSHYFMIYCTESCEEFDRLKLVLNILGFLSNFLIAWPEEVCFNLQSV